MVLSIEEWIFLVEHVFRATGEYTEAVKQEFLEKFPTTELPHRNAVRILISKFRESGSVHDASLLVQPTIFTEEKVNTISEAMTKSPTKPLRRLFQQVGISYGTAHAAVRKIMGLYPHRISCQIELNDAEFAKRLQYCLWFKRNLNENDVVEKTFFSDEAWFHLSGYVSSQNSRVWSSQNPHKFVEKPLH